MNGKHLLGYLREVQRSGVKLEDLRVGVIASTEGTDVTLLGVKRISAGSTSIVLDVGLQDATQPEKRIIVPEIKVAS